METGVGPDTRRDDDLLGEGDDEDFECIPPFRTVFTVVATMDGHVAAPEETVGSARFGLMLEVQSLVEHALGELNREHPGLQLGVVDMQVREIPQ